MKLRKKHKMIFGTVRIFDSFWKNNKEEVEAQGTGRSPVSSSAADLDVSDVSLLLLLSRAFHVFPRFLLFFLSFFHGKIQLYQLL